MPAPTASAGSGRDDADFGLRLIERRTGIACEAEIPAVAMVTKAARAKSDVRFDMAISYSKPVRGGSST